MRVVVRPTARREIDEAVDFYEEQLAGLGSAFLEAVEDALTRISRSPESFPVVHRDARRLVIRRYPYVLIFRIADEVIQVVACFHTARNPLSWRRRLN